MASLHFVVSAPVLARGDKQETGRNLALGVEVEGSAPIKSKAELIRAARDICSDEIMQRVRPEAEELGDFVVTETKELEKDRAVALTSASWPGVAVWRVAEERPPLAA